MLLRFGGRNREPIRGIGDGRGCQLGERPGAESFQKREAAVDEPGDGRGEGTLLRHHATAAGRILAVLAHELERGAAWGDATAMEGEALTRVPPAESGLADDREKIAPDPTATGHDNCADKGGRDRRVDRVAARRQHTQTGRRDERMLRADDAVSRQDGADPAPVAACRFRRV